MRVILNSSFKDRDFFIFVIILFQGTMIFQSTKIYLMGPSHICLAHGQLGLIPGIPQGLLEVAQKQNKIKEIKKT